MGVSPIKHGDFPASHVSFQEGYLLGCPWNLETIQKVIWVVSPTNWDVSNLLLYRGEIIYLLSTKQDILHP